MSLPAGGGKPCPHGMHMVVHSIYNSTNGRVSPQNGKSGDEVEKAVLEEFGRCMTQIISSAQSGWCQHSQQYIEY